MRWFVLAACPVLVVAGATTPVWAMPSSDSRKAEALFDEARTLFDRGELDAACTKFQRSLELEAAVGTRYHLAECLVRIDRLIDAAEELAEVARVSREANRPDRARHADERRRAVVERTPEIELRIAPQGAPVTVELDGVPIPSSDWKRPILLDPGRHIVRVWSPGRAAWSDEIEVEARQKQLVQIPLLAAAKPATSGAAPPHTPAGSRHALDASNGEGPTARDVGIGVTAGAGLAGIAVGTIFGVHALTTHESSLEECRADDPTRCTAAGLELRDDARTAGTASTVSFAIGASFLTGAALLWLTDSGGDEAPAVSVSVDFDRGAAGARLKGTF